MVVEKKKRRNPFEEWQHNRVNARIEYIENALLQLREGQFENVSSLANYVATLLTQHEKTLHKLSSTGDLSEEKVEPKPVAKSTLLRNDSYRTLLDSFIAGTRKTLGEVKVREEINDLALPKVQMELVRVKRDLARMTAYIEKLETERGGNRLGGPRCAEDGDTTLYELKRKYHMLCQAFINLYSSPPAMDLFEIVNGNLVDHSSRGQVVVEGDLIEPIVDRLKNIDKKKLKI